MKYLTPELINGDSDEAWQQALSEYGKQFLELRPRLSARAFKFFSEVSLHNGTLVSFIAGDTNGVSIDNLKVLKRNRRRTAVSIDILTFQQDYLYALKFSDIKNVSLEFPMENEPNMAVGDLLYFEITPVDNVHLKYEIVFSSRATIAVEFERFSFVRHRIEGSARPVS